MYITDFHTHAFPDALAERAMATLLAETGEVTARLDGRLSSLLASMDKSGIHRAVLCSIATRPEQFEKILTWSQAIRSERIIPFPSVHPDDPALRDHVARIADAGFKGVKFHPYYQSCALDDPRALRLYATCSALGLLLVCHTGFDIAFPRDRVADPRRIAAVVDRFPDLRFVATHLGGWHDWDEVERHLCGRPIYMELSMSLDVLSRERARELILKHPRDYVLFGSDSPWSDQSETLAYFRALGLDEAWQHAVLAANAARLLD